MIAEHRIEQAILYSLAVPAQGVDDRKGEGEESRRSPARYEAIVNCHDDILIIRAGILYCLDYRLARV